LGIGPAKGPAPPSPRAPPGGAPPPMEDPERRSGGMTRGIIEGGPRSSRAIVPKRGIPSVDPCPGSTGRCPRRGRKKSRPKGARSVSAGTVQATRVSSFTGGSPTGSEPTAGACRVRDAAPRGPTQSLGAASREAQRGGSGALFAPPGRLPAGPRKKTRMKTPRRQRRAAPSRSNRAEVAETAPRKRSGPCARAMGQTEELGRFAAGPVVGSRHST